ncbi:MAG: hypothetical protein P4L81_02575, partial [Candidatus Pacebacteria bacterium]|nr:hypothetical protein [Candidatus Paceibacterota bacterium]
MKAPIIGGLVTGILLMALPVHADSIHDPVTDTLHFWSSIVNAIQYVLQEAGAGATALGRSLDHVAQTAAVDQAISSATAQQEVAGNSSSVSSISSPTDASQTNIAQESSQQSQTQQPTAPAQTTIVYVPSNESALSSNLTSLTTIVGNLISLIPTSSQTQTNTPFPQQVAANGNPDVPYAAASNIGNLSNVTISNA